MKIQHSLYISLMCLTVAACPGGSSDDDDSSGSGSSSVSGSSSSGKVSYSGSSYPFDNGIELVSNNTSFPAKNHYACTFHITDGEKTKPVNSSSSYTPHNLTHRLEITPTTGMPARHPPSCVSFYSHPVIEPDFHREHSPGCRTTCKKMTRRLRRATFSQAA